MKKRLAAYIRLIPRYSSDLSLLAIAVLLGLSQSVHAEAFSPDATAHCLAEAEMNSPSRGSFSVLECVGQSAQACMRKPGQDNTLGMMECLSIENEYWENRMLVALTQAREAAEQADAETPLFGARQPSVVEQLDAMQVAWEAYRNAACLYEQSLWLGGSGGGPATEACYMAETARQTLKLEGWWAQ